MPDPLIVHHYYPLGSGNVGDHMVARAIRAAVPRFFGPCEFVDMPVNDRYEGNDRPIGLRGENLERTNREADLVIIGGSNLLEPRKARKVDGSGPRRGRWSVFTDVESIEKLRVPLMLLGMGTGSGFGKSIRPYLEPATGEVRALHNKAFASAVRDVTTVRELARIGVTTRCTGCPVTFLTSTPVTAQAHDLPLFVSLPPVGIQSSWAGRWFMRGTLDYIDWLLAEKVPTVVSLHDDRDVDFAKERFASRCEVFYTTSLDEQLERFSQARGVVGFRLHAALAALGIGKPVIPVGIDWRGLGFVETFDAQDISIRSMRLGQFSKLRRITTRLLNDDPAFISHLDRVKSRLQGEYESFLTQAAASFQTLRTCR